MYSRMSIKGPAPDLATESHDRIVEIVAWGMSSSESL